MNNDPIYVKLEEFGKVKKTVQIIKQLLKSATEKIQEIKEIKVQEDAAIKEREEKINRLNEILEGVEVYLK